MHRCPAPQDRQEDLIKVDSLRFVDLIKHFRRRMVMDSLLPGSAQLRFSKFKSSHFPGGAGAEDAAPPRGPTRRRASSLHLGAGPAGTTGGRAADAVAAARAGPSAPEDGPAAAGDGPELPGPSLYERCLGGTTLAQDLLRKSARFQDPPQPAESEPAPQPQLQQQSEQLERDGGSTLQHAAAGNEPGAPQASPLSELAPCSRPDSPSPPVTPYVPDSPSSQHHRRRVGRAASNGLLKRRSSALWLAPGASAATASEGPDSSHRAAPAPAPPPQPVQQHNHSQARAATFAGGGGGWPASRSGHLMRGRASLEYLSPTGAGNDRAPPSPHGATISGSVASAALASRTPPYVSPPYSPAAPQLPELASPTPPKLQQLPPLQASRAR